MILIAYYFVFHGFLKAIFIYFYKKNIISSSLIEIFLKFKNIIEGGNRLSKYFNYFYNIGYIISRVKCYSYCISKDVKVLKYPREVFLFF